MSRHAGWPQIPRIPQKQGACEIEPRYPGSGGIFPAPKGDWATQAPFKGGGHSVLLARARRTSWISRPAPNDGFPGVGNPGPVLRANRWYVPPKIRRPAGRPRRTNIWPRLGYSDTLLVREVEAPGVAYISRHYPGIPGGSRTPLYLDRIAANDTRYPGGLWGWRGGIGIGSDLRYPPRDRRECKVGRGARTFGRIALCVRGPPTATALAPNRG